MQAGRQVEVGAASTAGMLHATHGTSALPASEQWTELLTSAGLPPGPQHGTAQHSMKVMEAMQLACAAQSGSAPPQHLGQELAAQQSQQQGRNSPCRCKWLRTAIVTIHCSSNMWVAGVREVWPVFHGCSGAPWPNDQLIMPEQCCVLGTISR